VSVFWRNIYYLSKFLWTVHCHNPETCSLDLHRHENSSFTCTHVHTHTHTHAHAHAHAHARARARDHSFIFFFHSFCKQFEVKPDFSIIHEWMLPSSNFIGAMQVSPRTARSCFPLLAVFEHIRSYPRSQPSKELQLSLDVCNELGLKTLMNVIYFHHKMPI